MLRRIFYFGFMFGFVSSLFQYYQAVKAEMDWRKIQDGTQGYGNIFWQMGSSRGGIKDLGIANVKISAQISDQSG